MADERDQKFQKLMETLTTTIMLASNPGTDVDDRTRARLREPIKAVDDVRSNGGTAEEICTAIGGLLEATPLLAPSDALFLEPLRVAYDAYRA
ncbi:MAG TPA: hypothetical protein VMV92_11165 [Streptosporangiaceae bacterium]|nr:hypothetical protein [Streptosporangiaceae bacterium]